jgi:hypothetical protein
MKANLTPLLVAVASSFLLVGCCTTHTSQVAQWEYKVVAAPVVPNLEIQGGPIIWRINSEKRQKFLDGIAQEGWELVTIEGDTVYLKRPKR